VRVALISVAAGPVLVDLSDALDAGAVDGDRARDLVDAVIEPEGDIHATADYRRHLAHVLVRRAVDEATRRAA
jgi:carbon-monoxide dehydrogenase medium subunit